MCSWVGLLSRLGVVGILILSSAGGHCEIVLDRYGELALQDKVLLRQRVAKIVESRDLSIVSRWLLEGIKTVVQKEDVIGKLAATVPAELARLGGDIQLLVKGNHRFGSTDIRTASGEWVLGLLWIKTAGRWQIYGIPYPYACSVGMSPHYEVDKAKFLNENHVLVPLVEELRVLDLLSWQDEGMRDLLIVVHERSAQQAAAKLSWLFYVPEDEYGAWAKRELPGVSKKSRVWRLQVPVMWDVCGVVRLSYNVQGFPGGVSRSPRGFAGT